MAPAMVTIGLRPVTTRLNVPALVLHFVQAVVCIYENGHTMLQDKVSLMSPLNDLGLNITNNDQGQRSEPSVRRWWSDSRE